MIILLTLAILIIGLFFGGIIIIQDSPKASLGSFCLILILALFPAFSISNHVSDLAIIRHGKLLIEVREQAIREIDESMKSIKITQSVLMNADSPVSSLINTKAKFVEELANEKIRIACAKISIERRSLGFMYGVVKIFGKE